MRGLPEDGRRRIRSPVIGCGQFSVTALSGVRPGALEILFFDGAADASQMPPEGV
jgi:hypothetical protein